ncbi:HIT domain-containing protein [Chloroflexota bacterium]
MKYDELSEFLEHRMRMAHIYQPVMLKTLLDHHGQCSETDIARAILENDQSQIEYYIKITNNMVGRILRGHGIVHRVKDKYLLADYETLSETEKNNIVSLCRRKLKEYMQKRGAKIWSHRRISSGYISGTIRYEVFKRAKFHCELCGISADQRALEVDHIIPRNKGGSDEISNFQALCYSCNAMKRDKDDTNFHELLESFTYRESSCLFCNMDESRVIAENELAYAIYDAFPVTQLHTLIIPRRHVSSYFKLGQSEMNACTQLLNSLEGTIKGESSDIEGFNVGINDGVIAGQTIPHCHIHLIPRRQGDVQNPRGGVRHTIPGKGYY